MPDILIRGLEPTAIKRLKAKDKHNGRSLQKEAKNALEQAAGTDREEVARILAFWKERFKDRTFTESSVELIREDRDR